LIPELPKPKEKVQNEESEYLIFERHFESHVQEGEDVTDDELPTIFNTEDEGMNSEDLGIIDLDEDDIFDNIDDESLPVLKNTYSGKNRPNNSKSIAAGSKSKANRIDFGKVDKTPP
jgi:hypothetical protein